MHKGVTTVARKWELISLNSKQAKALKYLGAGLVISCLSSQVFAAAFQIQEQNASQLGLAYSGTAALAEDASTGFWNAAGLSYIENSQMTGSVVGIFGSFKYNGSATSSLLDPRVPPPPGAPIPVNGRLDNAADLIAVPSFHVATRFNEKWVLGFGVNSPFGLITKYGNDSLARYVATKSSLQTFNFGVSLAYQVLPCLSLGAGVDAVYGKADLQAQIGSSDVLGVDGFQHNSAEGWAPGFHAGVIWQVLPTTRLGLSYRSKINMHVEGDSEQLTPGLEQIIPGSSQIFNVATVRAKVTLPESVIFSLMHELNEQFTLTGDIHWTNWSRTDVLGLRFSPPNGTRTDTDTNLRFKDTVRVALGVIYNYSDCLNFRFGIAFDESPTTDEHRIARIPDEDRWWLGLGVAYTMNEKLRFDLGYAHLFFKDAHVNDQGPHNIAGTPVTAATFSAKYNSSANLVGIQFRYDFV